MHPSRPTRSIREQNSINANSEKSLTDLPTHDDMDAACFVWVMYKYCIGVIDVTNMATSYLLLATASN